MERIKFEYRSAIYQRLVAVYGDSAHNYCTVTRWFSNSNVETLSLTEDK